MDLVVAHGPLTADTIDECLKSSALPGECVIDLGAAKFVDPCGLVMIAAMAERARLDRVQVVFTAPRDRNCHNYVSRMELARALDAASTEHELQPVRNRLGSDTLIELQRFDSEDDLEVVTTRIMEILKREAGRWPPAATYDALFELAVNAVEHSGRHAGFLALQTFRRRSDIALAVADSGQGIRASLSANANQTHVTTDAVALQVAARKYESSVNQPGRGRGISNVIEATGRHQGTVLLMSGNAIGRFERGHIDPRVSRIPDQFLGTLAQARMSI